MHQTRNRLLAAAAEARVGRPSHGLSRSRRACGSPLTSTIPFRVCAGGPTPVANNARAARRVMGLWPFRTHTHRNESSPLHAGGGCRGENGLLLLRHFLQSVQVRCARRPLEPAAPAAGRSRFRPDGSPFVSWLPAPRRAARLHEGALYSTLLEVGSLCGPGRVEREWVSLRRALLPSGAAAVRCRVRAAEGGLPERRRESCRGRRRRGRGS
jgi:hypothetical protein